jgi:hypothetical protein
LRYAVRAKNLPVEPPKIEYIDLESKQGDWLNVNSNIKN